MLKLKYLFENFALAKEALEHWEHDADTLDRDIARYRISSNAIYPFHQEGKLCFLRLSPAEEKLQKNILGELEFISYLGRSGYPTLEPIMARSGETCMNLSTRWGAYYASASRSVKGVQIVNVEPTSTVIYQYGKALGRLHTLSSVFVPKIKKWSHTQVLGWIKSVLLEYHAPECVMLEHQAVERELLILPINETNYGLIHYDFEPDNVFYDEASEQCYVIDFDDSLYHWYALDIERVFASLEEELTVHLLEEAKATFINGYRSEFGYDANAESLLPLMRRFIDLFTYARLLRSTAEHMDDEPDWMLVLRQKIQTKMNDLEITMKKLHNR